jgi:glyoxylase-like metal-dependent hydrolase (beta-lactamase superfamily II)
MNLLCTIGAVEIFQIVELEFGGLLQTFLEKATPENIKKIEWLYPNYAHENGNLKALVQSFLIKSENKNILIDTCNGNDKKRTDIPEWGGLKTDFLQQLENAGISRTDIDFVACTHLHMDHIGWNTTFKNGKWVPTFPNAKYLFSKEEYGYWKSMPKEEIQDDKTAFEDSIAPITNAGLTELVQPNHKIDRNVSFIPTPGHTQSHVSILIESQGQRAMISGDIIHHPCQFVNPDWKMGVDAFPDTAANTRNMILDQVADTETLFIGSHFSNPVVGKVVRDNKSFSFLTK